MSFLEYRHLFAILNFMSPETISMHAFKLITVFWFLFCFLFALFYFSVDPSHSPLILTLANKTLFLRAVTVDAGPQF